MISPPLANGPVDNPGATPFGQVEALLHKWAAGRIPPEDDRELEGGLRLGHAEPSHGIHGREARIDLGHLTAETACLEPGTE